MKCERIECPPLERIHCPEAAAGWIQVASPQVEAEVWIELLGAVQVVGWSGASRRNHIAECVEAVCVGDRSGRVRQESHRPVSVEAVRARRPIPVDQLHKIGVFIQP